MELPVELHSKIIEFLTSLPNVHDSSAQLAFINSAGLDGRLKDQIDYTGSPAQFFQLLVSTLIDYGILEDGRDALEAVLDAAKNSVGQDRREYCDSLIRELRAFQKLGKYSHPTTETQAEHQVVEQPLRELEDEMLVDSKAASNNPKTQPKAQESHNASETVNAVNSTISDVGQSQIHGNVTDSEVYVAGKELIRGNKFDFQPGSVVNIIVQQEIHENLEKPGKVVSIDTKIICILYVYSQQHPGDRKMSFPELLKISEAKKADIIQCLYGLQEKRWVEYDLTETAESGLVWLTQLGLRVAKDACSTPTISR